MKVSIVVGSHLIASTGERSRARLLGLFCWPLEIETGRYENLPYQEQLCNNMRSNNEVKNEFHFLFHYKGLCIV